MTRQERHNVFEPAFQVPRTSGVNTVRQQAHMSYGGNLTCPEFARECVLDKLFVTVFRLHRVA